MWICCVSRKPLVSDGAKPWMVYMIRAADNSLYTGITNDLDQRLAAHEQGRGAKYLRGRQPLEVVWSEHQPDRSAAAKREAAIKRLSRSEKLDLVDEKQS